jgi:pimeloyl-ACP methyl ester carboxylesterase
MAIPDRAARGRRSHGWATAATMTALLVLVLAALGCTASTGAGPAPPGAASATSPEPGRPSPGRTGSTASDDTAATGAPRPRPSPTIAWRSCGSGVECATVLVPRDAARPDGDQLDLAVARRPATGPGERIGTLFFNPGGPGAAGTTYVKGASLDPELNERFDIVSWDPRGVGGSAPVACDDHTRAYQALDWSPDDATEQGALDSAAREIASDCAASYEHLDSLTTDATARDLDALRAAVGDDQVSFIGFSYGTFIGLRYAELFPTRVRAMVLDGVVDPTQDLEGLLAGQTRALETHMDQVFASCRPPTCPLKDAAATYDRIAARVETAPLVGRSGRPVGPTVLAFAAISSSYDAHGQDTFLRALAAADAGDGAALSSLAQQYWDSSSYPSYLAILCADSPHPDGAEAYSTLATHLRAISPRFGETMANEVLACAFWKTPNPPAPRPAVHAPGAPPILVVGNTGDVATPLQAAQDVAGALERGVLLTYAGQGHTSFGKSSCVDAAIRAYLTELTTPPPAKSC